MSSNIVPSTIDHTYPVAGRDNDSQGFRDNFTNIKNNFEYAEAEIDDIQLKGIFKSALTGGTLDNDMAGALISNAQIKGFRELRIAKPETIGAIALDVSAGQYQTISSTGSITLSFTNWAATANYSKIRVQIEIDNTAHTITLPSQVTLGYVQGLVSDVITVPKTGTYIYEFSTQDAGATIIISDVTPLPAVLYRTIATSTGSAGDHVGMMAYDTNYIYTCIADYDGTTAIWKRVASGATW